MCVCGAVGAVPEIITEGLNGFLVKNHDVLDLVSKLSECINDGESMKMNEIRILAMKRAKDFSINKYIENIKLTFDCLWRRGYKHSMQEMYGNEFED